MKRTRRPSPTHRPDVERAVADLVRSIPGVRPGKMFGLPAFYAGRKLFACVYGASVGLKLPEETIRGLHGSHIVPFQPYGKPPMRQWIEIRRARATDYRCDAHLFRQAAEFVLEPRGSGGRR